MNKNFRFIAILALLLAFGISNVHAQGRILRRIQQEVERKAEEEIFKGRETETTTPGDGSEESRRARTHQRGGGLSEATIDVNQAITDAENAYGDNNYRGTKAALREALKGVEIEIGHGVLESLPETVAGLEANKERDRVNSTGTGLIGLMIERTYEGRTDMEFSVAIGNESALLGLTGMYFAEGFHLHDADQTNQKEIRFQDHQALIRYDDNTGYGLSVPFGQSSILVLNGVNFESEASFMAAANQIKLAEIKQKLGTQ